MKLTPYEKMKELIVKVSDMRECVIGTDKEYFSKDDVKVLMTECKALVYDLDFLVKYLDEIESE